MWGFTLAGDAREGYTIRDTVRMDLSGENMSALPSEANLAISFFLPLIIKSDQ